MAVQVLAEPIVKKIRGDFFRGRRKIVSDVECRMWYREGNKNELISKAWGGSFEMERFSKPFQPDREPLTFKTRRGERVRMSVVNTVHNIPVGMPSTFFCEMVGFGAHPKELYDAILL